MTPLNTIIEEEKKEFNDRIANYIRLVEVGQYNDQGVNIGFIPATQVIQNFLTTAIQRAYEAGEQKARVERDTYWKERVRKEINEISRHWIEEATRNPDNFEVRIKLDALDTLLDTVVKDWNKQAEDLMGR